MAILGITDDGVISAANFARLAAVAVAVTNTAAAIEMAEKQEKMAKDYRPAGVRQPAGEAATVY